MGVSKVELSNGDVLIDLTNDSVTPETLLNGVTAHGADGEPIVGKVELLKPLEVTYKTTGEIDTPVEKILEAFVAGRPIYLVSSAMGLMGLCVGVIGADFVFAPYIDGTGQFLSFRVNMQTGQVTYVDVSALTGNLVTATVNSALAAAKDGIVSDVIAQLPVYDGEVVAV